MIRSRMIMFFLGIGRVLLWTALLFGGTALVVWPVWALAMGQRAIFTALCTSGAVILASWAILRRILSGCQARKIGKR